APMIVGIGGARDELRDLGELCDCPAPVPSTIEAGAEVVMHEYAAVEVGRLPFVPDRLLVDRNGAIDLASVEINGGEVVVRHHRPAGFRGQGMGPERLRVAPGSA